MKLSATSTSITAKGFVATSGDVTPTPDTTAPTLTIYTSANSLVANETATITFNWSEIVIGFGDGDITTTGGTLSAISGSGATYTAVFTPTAQSTTDGVITVGANVVVDGASNANTSGDTLTMTVDTTVGSSNTCTWSMRYHMYGSSIGRFEVYVEQSGSFTRILEKVNQQHTSTTDEWDLFTYDFMPSFAGQDIRIYCIYKHLADVSFRADVAIDALTLTTNGTAVDFSGENNSARWREGGEHGSLTAAQTNSSWTALNTTLDNRKWNIDPGGPTVSSTTGPDQAYDNNINTAYIYFEASVTGQTLPQTKWYPLRTTDVISVPS